MTSIQWFVHVAMLAVWAFGSSSASASKGAVIREQTGTEPGNVVKLFPSFRAIGDLQPSTVTVTAAQRTMTVIKTIVKTTVETTVINAATATTAILTVPLTVNGIAFTSTVYFQTDCTVRGLTQETLLTPLTPDETRKEAVNSGQNSSVIPNNFDRSSQKNDSTPVNVNVKNDSTPVNVNVKNDSTPVNVTDKVLDSKIEATTNKTSIHLPSILHHRPQQSQNGSAVFEKGVPVYPPSKFTSVMSTLSQLVEEMKKKGSRTDLVQRYEEVSRKEAMYRIREPETRLQELEEMAGEVLEEAQKGGHESDLFFARLEKFVGFMETIYLS